MIRAREHHHGHIGVAAASQRCSRSGAFTAGTMLRSQLPEQRQDRTADLSSTGIGSWSLMKRKNDQTQLDASLSAPGIRERSRPCAFPDLLFELRPVPARARVVVLSPLEASAAAMSDAANPSARISCSTRMSSCGSPDTCRG